MPFYYPQAAISLLVRIEDFGNEEDVLLNKLLKINCLAKRFTVNINDYTQADEFDCELDYRYFPFDPRCIRSMQVSICLEDRKIMYDPNTGGPLIIKPRDNYYDSLGNHKPNPKTGKFGNYIFTGFADEETITFDESTRHIKFSGRDFTSLFLDYPWHGKTLDPSKPLDLIIEELVKEVKGAEKIKVINRTGSALPVIKSFAPDLSAMAAQVNSKKNRSYWEVMNELCSRAARVMFIELDKLIISKPRAIYGDSNIHHFIYGKNLSNLEIKRKLGRRKGINVVVRSLVPERDPPLLEARIPLEATESWAKEVGVERKAQTITKIGADGKEVEPPEEAPYLSFLVPDIGNIDILKEIGENIWEEIGRQQLEGSFETKDIAGYQDNNVLFDYTKIRNGTPIKVEIDQGDIDKLKRIESESAKSAFLIKSGYNPIVANQLARTLSKFDTRFYTKSVEFSMDRDQGFAMKLDFINLIELTNKTL